MLLLDLFSEDGFERWLPCVLSRAARLLVDPPAALLVAQSPWLI
jgi:hypothetical protein